MAFQFPHANKNFIGVHADGPAATAWVLAQCWDTNGNGTGTPQQGMVYYDLATNLLYFWNGVAWANFAGEATPRGIYVDILYGNDLTGNGTLGRPYATLAGACAAQAEPDPGTGADTFMTPIIFYVAPGKYTDDVTYPQRIGIAVVGEDCEISGTHSWDIDPQWWDFFGINTDIAPYLAFQGRPYAPEISPHLLPATPGAAQRQFVLSNGLLQATNRNPTAATPMPDWHTLIVDNVVANGFPIWNKPCATLLTDQPTGPMYAYLRNLRNAWKGPEAYIAGEVDRVEDGMGGGLFSANTVYVWAEDSDVALAGVCRIMSLRHCRWAANYAVDHAGAAYAYGKVEGDYLNKYGQRVQVVDSELLRESWFGTDTKATVPAHFAASAIVFDRTSLASLARTTTDFLLSFVDFSEFGEGAYTRGWMYDLDDLDLCATVRIPCVNSGDSPLGVEAGRLFRHTYGCASYWLIDGNVLAADNRLRVEVEAGLFRFETALNFDLEFVDVVGAYVHRNCGGFNAVPLVSLSDRRGGTIFQFESTASCFWECDSGGLDSIWMEREAGAGPSYEDVLTFMVPGEDSTFRNLWFASVNTGGIYTPQAVGVGLGLAGMVIGGRWEDCGTDLSGLFHECSISGTFIRCVGGQDSFAGGYPNDTDGFNICAGYFEDCIGGNYSFGATRVVAGDATCGAPSTVMKRCVAGRRSFGATEAGGNATFAAWAQDCIAYGASFGAALGATGDALCAGMLIDCLLSGKGGRV